VNPSTLIALSLLGLLLSTALLTFAGMLYYHALQLKALSVSADELSFNLHGLPQNLYGIVGSVTGFTGALQDHVHQMEGLVMVIREANAEKPKVEPFKEDGKDTNWVGEVPPSPFDTTDESA